MSSRLVLLKRSQIDEIKWNRAIGSSSGATLYGFVSSLDLLAGDWDALVWGDYSFVMPLPFRKKFGIRYVYTPLFIQRLDIFGGDCSNEMRQVFMTGVKAYCKYFDMNVAFAFTGNEVHTHKRVNFVLSLEPGYDVIAASYQKEAKRSIQKAVSRHCIFTNDVTPAEVVGLYRQVYGKKVSGSINDYHNMHAFAKHVAASGNLVSCGVKHGLSGELLFGALFFISGRRIYYLLGAPTEKGRYARAGYFMIDAIIREYAGKNYQLDFEGSDIPGVAAFYRKFNPEEETYYRLHYNKLPWLIRLFKK